MTVRLHEEPDESVLDYQANLAQNGQTQMIAIMRLRVG